MMIPTIHLNGTSRQELMRQMIGAHVALCAAIEAVSKMVPNGRDFYPQGLDAISQATREHWERLAKLESVRAEIESMAVGITFDDD